MRTLGSYSLNSIITGDARSLAEAIPDNSIDLIFTDPPYDDKSVPLYGWLAEIAARVLKPGGFCFAYTGNRWLNRIMPLMNESLDFFWMLCGYQPESNMVFYDKNIGTGWRPILVYSKNAKRAPRFMQDTRRTNRDKDFHKWGQGVSLPMYYINLFADAGSIVFDPFCGGGTTLAVCKMLGVQCLTFEIDQATADLARRRVELTPIPLFTTAQPEQLCLIGGAL